MAIPEIQSSVKNLLDENDVLQIKSGNVEVNHMDVLFKSARGEAVLAVQDFSMSTRPGEFVCLIGPSGCGKSTVLNVIAGFVSASAGCVTLDDKLITKPAPDRGVVFQNYALFPWKTVQANVEFGLRLQNKSKDLIQSIAKEKIEQVGLSSFSTKYPHELSGGMQQRVGIARILACNPQVMLMDEPFGALDAQTRELMQELLLKVWEKNRTTVIFVTHDLDEAILLSDTIYIMTARPGTVKEVISNPLSRPRSMEMLTSEEFLKIKRKLTSVLREEIFLAMKQSGV